MSPPATAWSSFTKRPLPHRDIVGIHLTADEHLLPRGLAPLTTAQAVSTSAAESTLIGASMLALVASADSA